MNYLAPTGEPFVVFSEAGFQSREDAVKGAHAAFDKYQAGNRGGVAYWRVFPEFKDHGAADGHSYYMRLLISSKDVKTS